MEDKDYSIDLLMLYFQTFVCRQALYFSPFILAGQVSKDTISSFWLIKKERKKEKIVKGGSAFRFHRDTGLNLMDDTELLTPASAASHWVVCKASLMP